MDKRNKKSSGHLSRAQKEALLDLMRERPVLGSGKFSKNFTLKDGQQAWETITSILNAIPGSQKDWRLWRKTWQDLQSKAKSKNADFNKAFNKTGGGPPPDPMNDFEEGVVALINKNSVEGHEGVAESIVEFHANEEDAVEIPDIQPPPEIVWEYEVTVDQEPNPDYQDQGASGSGNNREPDQHGVKENRKKTGANKKKINMKSLLKEKIELKRKLVESTIQFQTHYLKLQEDRNLILKDLLSNFNEGKNK